MSRLKFVGTVAIAWGLAAGASVLSMKVTAAAADATDAPTATASMDNQARTPSKTPLDRSGHKRVGKASFYASRYSNRVMSDGSRMRPESNNAASLTLPLGTTARVTNLAHRAQRLGDNLKTEVPTFADASLISPPRPRNVSVWSPSKG